jgi:hypothetical protein
VTRENVLGLGGFVVATAAMGVDHLLGTDPDPDESGLVDPAAFVISVVASLLITAVLFLRVVPRTIARGTDRAAVIGLTLSVLACVPGLGLLWLGVPFPIAAAGCALGLAGRDGTRRALGTSAVGLGATFIVLGAALYAWSAVDRVV